jgi:hypothetical protein
MERFCDHCDHGCEDRFVKHGCEDRFVKPRRWARRPEEKEERWWRSDGSNVDVRESRGGRSEREKDALIVELATEVLRLNKGKVDEQNNAVSLMLRESELAKTKPCLVEVKDKPCVDEPKGGGVSNVGGAQVVRVEPKGNKVQQLEGVEAKVKSASKGNFNSGNGVGRGGAGGVNVGQKPSNFHPARNQPAGLPPVWSGRRREGSNWQFHNDRARERIGAQGSSLGPAKESFGEPFVCRNLLQCETRRFLSLNSRAVNLRATELRWKESSKDQSGRVAHVVNQLGQCQVSEGANGRVVLRVKDLVQLVVKEHAEASQEELSREIECIDLELLGFLDRMSVKEVQTSYSFTRRTVLQRDRTRRLHKVFWPAVETCLLERCSAQCLLVEHRGQGGELGNGTVGGELASGPEMNLGQVFTPAIEENSVDIINETRLSQGEAGASSGIVEGLSAGTAGSSVVPGGLVKEAKLVEARTISWRVGAGLKEAWSLKKVEGIQADLDVFSFDKVSRIKEAFGVRPSKTGVCTIYQGGKLALSGRDVVVRTTGDRVHDVVVEALKHTDHIEFLIQDPADMLLSDRIWAEMGCNKKLRVLMRGSNDVLRMGWSQSAGMREGAYEDFWKDGVSVRGT